MSQYSGGVPSPQSTFTGTGSQPTHPSMMQMQPIAVGPPGFAISNLDTVIIKQSVEILEVLTGIDTPNSYSIMDVRGFEFMRMAEITNSCEVCILKNNRNFVFVLLDPIGRQIDIQRTTGCSSYNGLCCPNKVEVAMGGVLFGSVEQQLQCGEALFHIHDANGLAVLKIIGPCCPISCCSDIEYPIYTMNGVVVGTVTRKYPGFIKEAFTAADNYFVMFPLDLDTRVKFTLLAAAILIDFMYFENTSKGGNRHRGGYGYY